MSILTIQSHVSYGHVGNSAAVFPLQRMGFEVWPVQTVLFSNHGGYPTLRGPVLKAGDVSAVIEGIEERHVFPECQAVLSGYLGSSELGEVVLKAVHKVKAANPAALYCCDPVMGDRGKDIYVKADIPDFMRRHILPAADILIPNHFELETLVQQKLSHQQDILKAAYDLLDQGPQYIVVTSVECESYAPDTISMLAISKSENYRISTPKLPFITPPSGAGDFSAALFLAHFLQSRDLSQALSAMTAGIYNLLKYTYESKSPEIALITGQESYIHPQMLFQCEEITV